MPFCNFISRVTVLVLSKSTCKLRITQFLGVLCKQCTPSHTTLFLDIQSYLKALPMEHQYQLVFNLTATKYTGLGMANTFPDLQNISVGGRRALPRCKVFSLQAAPPTHQELSKYRCNREIPHHWNAARPDLKQVSVLGVQISKKIRWKHLLSGL